MTTNSVKVNAIEHGVSAVTVFQANRAEVKRRLQVELKAGQNEVEIEKLPNVIDQDSIRVDGFGNAVIYDVVYHPPPPTDPAAEHAEALAALHKKKKALEGDNDILEREAKVLENYSRTLSDKHTNTEQLGTFLDTYATRQRKINEASTELQEKIKEVEKQIKAEKTSLHADEESKKRSVKVTVVVLAAEDGPAEISMTYVVSNASWSPLYDLRAKISNDPKTPSTVSLHYRASISQSTGEDWSGVQLTLSTASPQLGSTIPTLSPHWLNQVYTPPTRGLKKSKSISIMPALPQMARAGAPPSDGIFGSAPAMSLSESGYSAPPPFLRVAEATASEGGVTAVFGIEGLSSIPSDTDKSSQTHKVSISVIELTADLQWIAVPKELPSAFLQAKVKNTSQYLLLPGPANVFLDDNFVAKSEVGHVSPQESFSCSLGVDPQIRVTYHPQNRKTKASGGSILTTRTITSTYSQRITIKNTRRTPLHKLILKDQVPVSADARIKVNLTEPELVAGKNAREVAIAKGIRARWAPKDDEDSGEVTGSSVETAGDNGLIEWLCDIEPGATIDVAVVWEVNAPQGLNWNK